MSKSKNWKDGMSDAGFSITDAGFLILDVEKSKIVSGMETWRLRDAETEGRRDLKYGL